MKIGIIVMNTKMVREPLTTPPQYIAEPVKLIMESKPSTGLINDIKSHMIDCKII